MQIEVDLSEIIIELSQFLPISATIGNNMNERTEKVSTIYINF